MTTSTTSIQLESDPAQLAELRSRLNLQCRDAGLLDPVGYQFTTAIIEAVNNIVQHGYRGETGHPITIHWHRVDDTIRVEIRDRGQARPVDFLDHALMPPTGAWSGRGDPIVLAWTDSPVYVRDGDENVLYLRPRLSCDCRAPASTPEPQSGEQEYPNASNT